MSKSLIKSVLMLSSAESNDTRLINDAFVSDINRRQPPKIDVRWCNYQNVGLKLSASKLQAFLIDSHTDLASFDLVNFKSYYRYQEQAVAIADSLIQSRTNFIGHELKDYRPAFKLTQMARLTAAGVNVPATIYLSRTKYLEEFEYVRQNVGLPFIFKAVDGRTGDDNHLVRSHDQLQGILQNDDQATEYLAQEFIENEGDYRFIVMGGEVKMVIYRSRTSSSTHLNNTSKGAQASLVPIDKVDPIMIELALQATALTGRDIAGVDIMVDSKTGKTYILEVNASPQLASGAFASQKLAICAEYFEQEAAHIKAPIGQVGRAEFVDFPKFGLKDVPAKIDTGADRSSIWASGVKLAADGYLEFCLFGQGSEYYSGKIIKVPKSMYHQSVFENSFGMQEKRYVVKLSIVLKDRRIRGSFSLADRSSKTYPVLLGRRLLHGKFLVDVTAGEPLVSEEQQQTKQRQKGVNL